MHIKLIGLNARYTHSCLALFYVRNELGNHCDNVETEILQFTINDVYYELLLNLTKGEPDYYFFSAAIWNSDLVIKLIIDLQRCIPGASCVVGGPQAEVVGKIVGSDVCTVVTGEIERVDSKFFNDLSNNCLDGKYVSRKTRGEFSLPYCMEDFQSHLQNRHLYYETSRGCPFSCTYCLSSAEKGVFRKDLEHVKDELRYILSFKPGVVRFIDRTFNDIPERALAIWQFLLGQDCQTKFHFEISPERFTQEMFDMLAQLPVGKFQLEIGIQSTNQKTLSAVRRPMDTVEAHNTITRLRDIENIHLHVDLILGLPYETKLTFLQSFRDVFNMRPHYIQMGLLKILPNTSICHTSLEFEYSYSAAPPYSVLSNKWMDHDAMQSLYWFSECVERFLNNRYFVSLWDYLLKTAIDIVAFFLNLLEKCLEKQFFKLAATQELLCALILDCVEDWQDYPFICELLRYDWLRCGHRFLPGKLQVAEVSRSRSVKKRLFHQLSHHDTNSYTREELSSYFKKGFFQFFSKEVINYLGFANRSGQDYLCFLPEREKKLHGFCKVVHFSSVNNAL